MAAASSYCANHPADEGSAERRTDRHRNRVEPCAMQGAIGQLAQVRLVGLANLGRGDGHRARNAPIRQPKKMGGETGMGTRETSSATMAAQNGCRLVIAEM